MGRACEDLPSGAHISMDDRLPVVAPLDFCPSLCALHRRRGVIWRAGVSQRCFETGPACFPSPWSALCSHRRVSLRLQHLIGFCPLAIFGPRPALDLRHYTRASGCPYGHTRLRALSRWSPSDSRRVGPSCGDHRSVREWGQRRRPPVKGTPCCCASFRCRHGAAAGAPLAMRCDATRRHARARGSGVALECSCCDSRRLARG